ncbi:hypothetical protein E2542_SST15480 [Spatholobus suberectus]|nr:hypothetical protein E2542_SST15480 [Spatholobus suberectus]
MVEGFLKEVVEYEGVRVVVVEDLKGKELAIGVCIDFVRVTREVLNDVFGYEGVRRRGRRFESGFCGIFDGGFATAAAVAGGVYGLEFGFDPNLDLQLALAL